MDRAHLLMLQRYNLVMSGNAPNEPRLYPIRKGEVFAQYRVLEPLGAGGMGIVYKAEDTRLKRFVALKFLGQGSIDSQESKARFVREAQAAAAISHPNVATVYELGQTDELEFIAMELVNGVTLKDKICDRVIEFQQINDIFEQVCNGVAVAHEEGIIHRDIKSTNIMLTNSGQVKILDFGLARLSHEGGMTQTGKTMGTVQYMSPEQVRGEPADQRSDIWALGVVLFEMLTLRLPFTGDSWQSVIHAITNREPPPICDYRSDVPEFLEQLTVNLLEKDPELRPSSVRHVLEHLQGSASHLETRFFESSRAVFEDKRSVAVLPFVNRSSDPEKDYFSDGLADELIGALGMIEGLHVVARSSAFSFKGQDIDIRDIGKKLNVSTILEGSVRWAGTRLRIAVQAVDIRSGYQIWNQQFDRELVDIFDVQQEIAVAIVERLKGELVDDERNQIMQRPTDDIDAYELYLQGKYFLGTMDPVLIEKGLTLQKEAVSKAPDFQLANVEIAEAYCLVAEWELRPALVAYPEALKWAERALEMDEKCAEVHAVLGSIHTHFTWNWTVADRHFRRAIDLNPNLARAHNRFAEYLRYLGYFDEAIDEAICARDLDPLALSTNWTLGATLAMCGHGEQALKQARKTVDMFPQVGYTYFLQALIEEGMDQNGAAIETIKKGQQTSAPLPVLYSLLGYLYGKTGKVEQARECLAELQKMGEQMYIPSFAVAAIYAGLKERDSMFEYLERAYEERNWHLIMLKLNPWFDFVRQDPRLNVLLQKIGMIDN